MSKQSGYFSYISITFPGAATHLAIPLARQVPSGMPDQDRFPGRPMAPCYLYIHYMVFALHSQLNRHKIILNNKNKQVPAYLSQAPASVFQKLSYEHPAKGRFFT